MSQTQTHEIFNVHSTYSNIEELFCNIQKLDNIHDNILPQTQALANKMINTQQQLNYQMKTRENKCLPLGIAKQCKFSFSGNNPEVQNNIQQLFYQAGSRSLDLIINHTKSTTESLKRRYYSKLDELKLECTDCGVDFNTIHNKIQTSMRNTKNSTSKIHNKKILRDEKHFKLYCDPEEANPPIIACSKTHKPNRRFKKSKKSKNKPTRRPAYRRRRQKLKSTGNPITTNIDRFFYNLTDLKITDHHKMIFCLGQKFCPTPKGANWADFETSIDNWSYLLRYAVFYHDKNKDNQISYEQALIKRNHRKPINNSGRPALELFIQKVKNDLLAERKNKFVASNLNQDQQKALREMRFWERDHNIIIRPYDKGKGFFIDRKNSYEARVISELNSDLYVPVINKMATFNEVVCEIEKWSCKWQDCSLLTPVLREWITPDSTKKQEIFI